MLNVSYRWLSQGSTIGLCAVLGLVLATPAMAADYLQALRALSKHAHVTAMVVRLDDMKPIAELHPDERLTPASVSKLFTASAALEQFGPAHRFVSRFATSGQISGSTLHGNLVLVGDGDPSLDNPHLQQLVARLRARGITKVSGNLVIDESLWGTVPCLTPDRCDARARASHSYSAPLSAAGVNFGTVSASVYPGNARGDGTRVVLHPFDLPGYAIDNGVKTGPGGSRLHLRVWRTYSDGTSTLHLRGSLPAGAGPQDVHRAVTGAAAETGRVLAAMLVNAGIHVAGHVVHRTNAAPAAGTTLAEVKSATLAEQLIPMMAYSSNYMADTLTLDIAAASQYNKPLTLPRAAQALEALSQRANQAIFPKQSKGSAAVFDSGSGLTVGNKVSARDVIALLAYMYHQNALFPAFYGSLPVPLSAPSRTLKQGDLDFVTRLTAKTGTLSEPVTVRALGGYFRLASGGFGAYAFIINGTRSDPELTYHQTVTAYEQDMEKILARY